MPYLGNIQWVGYFHVFGAFYGYLNSLSCVGIFSGFTISMCLRNDGPNILRVWFKLRKFLFSDVIINMNVVL